MMTLVTILKTLIPLTMTMVQHLIDHIFDIFWST